MARIPLVQSGVAARTARTNLSIPTEMATGDAFGAGAARGVQALGGGLDRVAAGVDATLAARQTEEVANRVAQSDFTRRELELRNEVGPDGAGYQERVLDEYDAWVDEQAEAIEDDRVRTDFRNRMLGQRPGVSSRSASYELGTAAEYSSDQANLSLQALDNRIRLQPSMYDELIAQGTDVINARADVPANVRANMVAAWEQGSARSRFDGMLESANSVQDLDLIEAELRAEETPWIDMLRPQDLETLLGQISTARSSIRTQADAQARAALTSLEERAGDVSVLIPEDELRAVQGLVAASENPVTNSRMARIVRDQALISEFRASTPQQIRAVVRGVEEGASAVPYGQRRELDTAGAAFGVDLDYMTRVAGNGLRDTTLLPGLRDLGAGSGSTRDLPVSQEYAATLSGVVRQLGPDIDVRVVSAGQMSIAEARRQGAEQRGGNWYLNGEQVRTGSTRHDVDDHGHSHTSDFVLTRNGQTVTPDQDPALYEQFFEAAAPYFPGMGHYAWGVHVGGGSQAFWGPSTTGTDVNPRFVAAVQRGLQGGGAATVDPEFLERALDTPGVRDRLAGNETPERIVAAYASVAQTQLTETLGRAAAPEELYIAHQIGIEAAANLSRGMDAGDPDAVAQYQQYVAEYATAGPRGGQTAAGYNDQQTLTRVADDVETRLQDDPMTLASQTGVGTFDDLFGEGGFAQRGEDARRVSEYYSIPPSRMQPFTGNEMEAIQAAYTDADSDDILQILTQVQELGGDMARAGASQLDGVDPVLSYAAAMNVATGETGTASDVVRGQRRLADDPNLRTQMGATDGAVNSAFLSATGGALLGLPPRDRAAIQSAALAHYAETSAARGLTGSFDRDAFLGSVNAVLGAQGGAGALDDVNGATVWVPPGLTGRDLERAFDVMSVGDWTNMSLHRSPPRYATGEVANPEDIRDEVTLRSVGSGQYQVALSDGSLLVTGRAAENGRMEAFIFVPDVETIQARAEGRRELSPSAPLQGTGAPTDPGTPQTYDQREDVVAAREDGTLTEAEVQLLTERYGPMWSYDADGNRIQ